MATQSYLLPKSCNFWKCYVTLNKGIKVADEVSFAVQLTLKQGEYPELFGWVWYNLKNYLNIEEGNIKARVKSNVTEKNWMHMN